ncbi:PepSY-associated TM helix domain-containing protein [Galbibacter pacificus]|uniref:PepSY-associated TM helix domain-containing protein n=1 Tax=Galbibacter pacificus TaxID=2996052 RepID=A0ABT6FS92_9FLAO|nr:PepSY-associated TM helix domain-containing protein [Galbibacter pacificus]MDG3582751.1 PepSY-associated TM helix domain-containing protein [Galbibacter pacificus]MDG3586130.1 PepSY-associated TM helix domain-containing protein [Galbibacter pacificus]
MKKTTSKKKKKKSLFNRIVAWIHLWPSIVSGIILVFVCLTGTIIVYGDEIMDFTAGDAKYVEAGESRISSEEIVENLKKEYPDYMISEYVFFKDPERSIRIRAFNRKEVSLAMIYMNPYTGEILKKDSTIHFFFVTAHLHASLLAGEVGHWIVTISTIIFVISCITGLILWWPKRWNKTTRQASFTIKWKAKFKRLNYDLHNVYGFYSLLLCLVLSVTGLIIFFPSLSNLTIKATGGELTHLTDVLPKQDTTKVSKNMVPFAYEVLEKEHNNKQMVSIWNYDQQKLGAYVFTSGKVGLKSIENADLAIYNRYTGEKINVGEKLIKHETTENIVWQLHMGQWWGQFGKLSTFLAGIVATSLPITGFLIWWGRRKKKKKSSVI